jgi:ribonuclease T1
MKSRPSPLLWGLAILILVAFFYLFLANRPSRPAGVAGVTPPAAEAAAAASPAEATTEATAEPGAAARGRKTPAPTATATRKPRATATVPPTRDGLSTITPEELPPEALETLALIARGGPFPFSKDGTTFQNREQILPRKRGGYYREYTVITPGEDDRGARRIVAGAEGELYYTDDHYESFSRIVEP